MIVMEVFYENTFRILSISCLISWVVLPILANCMGVFSLPFIKKQPEETTH